MATKTPLSTIAQVFEELSQCGTKDEGLPLDKFCDACSLVSVLFNSLGLAFKFAEMEYVAKIYLIPLPLYLEPITETLIY
ncbi:hypothetical protein J1N35_026766 [Gossypium stocksii]|uniref:Uncharacterized protein n=1 Tax=Gossypium stocksii TaxID=47602 RepID=A0A9D3VA97_9ROSI|nr:hypothetical protein J1N35_026766 [Gossypium stocksii]